MNLTVALLTCDRFDLTKRTVDSLLEYNEVSQWTLLHADDHSLDDRVLPYIRDKGFKTVVANRGDRIGVTRITSQLFDECDDTMPLFYLQNDFQSLRPLPLDLVSHCLHREDIGWVRFYSRLYYRRWDVSEICRSGRLERIGDEWYVVGNFGYSDHPHVTHVPLARRIFANRYTEGGVMRAAEKTKLHVALTIPGVMLPTGRKHRTPGSKAGIPRSLRLDYLVKDGFRRA